MKQIKGMQLGAVLAAMLLLSMAFVPAVSAKVGGTQVADEKIAGGCTGCANNNGSCGIVGNATELQGAEKDKVFDMALKNGEVQQLQEQLKNEGFTQNGFKVYIIPVKTNSTVVSVPVIEINFKSPNGDKDKKIMYAQNPETGNTIVIQGSTEDCLLCIAGLAVCLGTCITCGAACQAPIAWLTCLPCILRCGGSCGATYIICNRCIS